MALRLGTSEHGGTFYTQGSTIAELYNRGRSGRTMRLCRPATQAFIMRTCWIGGSWS